MLFGRRLPDEPSGCGIERRDDAGHAEREQPAAVEERGGLGAHAVRRREHVRFVRCRVTRVPAFLPRRRVEGRHHLVAVAAGEDVDRVIHDEGSGVALSHVDLPPPGERVGPRRRLREGAGRAVPVHAAPLWIVASAVLRGASGDAGRHEDGAQERAAACGLSSTLDSGLHVVSISSRVEGAPTATLALRRPRECSHAYLARPACSFSNDFIVSWMRSFFTNSVARNRWTVPLNSSGLSNGTMCVLSGKIASCAFGRWL